MVIADFQESLKKARQKWCVADVASWNVEVAQWRQQFYGEDVFRCCDWLQRSTVIHVRRRSIS